jgi:hypothetical protein
MKTEQNQKRLLFIEQIKKNYSAIYAYQLIFYFDDYEISKISAAEYWVAGNKTSEYLISRRDQECGAVIMTHDFSNRAIIYLIDNQCSILYDITNNCNIHNYARAPLDLEQLKKELGQLKSALKSK